MPLVNYCRKCRTETPLGESGPYCGGRLPKTGEQLSFGIIRNPVKDWFSWNDVLRVALPAWLVALAAVLAAEASATGAAGVTALLRQGFLWVMLGLLAGMLAALLALMLLRGPEPCISFWTGRGSMPASTCRRAAARCGSTRASPPRRSWSGSRPGMTARRWRGSRWLSA